MRIIESENRMAVFDVSCLDDTVAVEVLHVDSPTSMWIRPTEANSEYVELAVSMMRFYKDEARGRRIDDAELISGRGCVVVSSTTVRRGRIIHVDDEGYAEVWLVDEGSSDFFDAWDIYHLEGEFEKLPAGAIQCGLADVQPISVDWSDSAQRYINDVSRGQIVIATLCTRVAENGSLWLKLSIEGNDVGNDLVWEGDALPHRQRLRCYS